MQSPIAPCRRQRSQIDVSAAFRPGALRVVYQPVVDLAAGRVVAVEALARFHALPRRSPDAWFAAAATAGRGLELEAMAVRAAVGALAAMPSDVLLTLNSSPAAVASGALAAALRDVPLDRVVIEVTEHEPVDDYRALAAALDPLREGGARVAVDDAGTGFATPRHVARVAPDIVKLDRAVVLAAVEGRLQTAARILDVTDRAVVIAEGIETAEQATAVRRLGIALGQGYHFGRPGPISAMWPMLAEAGSRILAA